MMYQKVLASDGLVFKVPLQLILALNNSLIKFQVIRKK